MTSRTSKRAAAVLALICVAPLYAAESKYPVRPLRMVVPFAPGGASDFVARIIQPQMVAVLGQQVVIENRAGAAGNIGVEMASRASPDGYTFLLGNVGTMAINQSMYPGFAVRPLRDLVGITQIVDVPGALVTHPSVPAKSVKEFIAYVRANPDKLNFGSSGGGSANRIEMEIFQTMTGTKMTHVPYKGGAGPAMTGLIVGEVQSMFVTFSSAVQFAKQNRIRMLGVIAPERIAALSDVPTMREQGFPSMTIGSWQGIFVPKSTSQSVMRRLFEVSQQTMKTPDVAKRLADGGVNVVLSASAAEFHKFWESEHQRFAKGIKDANIPVE
jgi:tripartite-type tricarboxylate transporter receptor subunit TctC